MNPSEECFRIFHSSACSEPDVSGVGFRDLGVLRLQFRVMQLNLKMEVEPLISLIDANGEPVTLIEDLTLAVERSPDWFFRISLY